MNLSRLNIRREVDKSRRAALGATSGLNKVVGVVGVFIATTFAMLPSAEATVKVSE